MTSEWQPIETAPTDGTEILGLINGEPVSIRYAEQRQCMLAGVGGGNGYFGPGWEDTQNGLACLDKPTHWKPAELEVFGTRYPIIKDLKAGWFLIAHPNGPAISTSSFQYMGSLAWPNADVPEMVRKDAIEALMDWAQQQPTYPRG